VVAVCEPRHEEIVMKLASDIGIWEIVAHIEFKFSRLRPGLFLQAQRPSSPARPAPGSFTSRKALIRAGQVQRLVRRDWNNSITLPGRPLTSFPRERRYSGEETGEGNHGIVCRGLAPLIILLLVRMVTDPTDHEVSIRLVSTSQLLLIEHLGETSGFR